MSEPVILCILDGWGLSERTEANATLITHGPDVGLPRGQMGNSEVGHTNIGAGRVVAMDLGQIDLAIEDGSFFENTAIHDFARTVKDAGGRAHLMGLVSDGGVHGHISHIKAAVKMLTDQGVDVVLHAITDGRDVAPTSAKGFIADLSDSLPYMQPSAPSSGAISRWTAIPAGTGWSAPT